MFERHLSRTAFHGCMVAVCLAFLAGCGPGSPTGPAGITVIAAPANFSATPGNATVALGWTAGAGATGYHVKRATTDGGPYTQLASPTSAGYTDSTVTNGTKYYYVVSALNAAGESANSAQVSATPAIPTAPLAPTNLVATAGNAQVGLVWTLSTSATSYHVKRATTSGGPYTQVGAPTAAAYTDTGLTNDHKYYYVVSAVNSIGESPNSAQVSAVPVVMNPPPTTFGTWTNVSPSGVDLTSTLCGNFGAQTVQIDPAHPSNLYTEFNCQGIWKSVDYGATWTGPLNTGTNAALVSDCVGYLAISPSSAASIPTIYQSCIRGNGVGFWKSVDGGVNWTNYVVTPGGSRQDYTAPVIDPYDQNHLLMAGHEQESLVESIDGGQTWTAVTVNSGMLEPGGTGAIFFINTGTASTTRATWLWIAAGSGGSFGTWRTSDNGVSWVQVDKNEHFGSAQIYQPDNNGVVFMAGIYSALGGGVLRSTDYGQTWTHFGGTGNETLVLGTAKNLYAMSGYPVGIGGSTDANFEVAAQPGTGVWVLPGTPAALNQGAAQISVVNDGTHNILVGAMYNSGIWRYVEP